MQCDRFGSHPLEGSPVLRQPSDEEEEAEAVAEEGKAISVAVEDYAASLTFNNEQLCQLCYKNDVAERGNNVTGGNDHGMNDDDGGDDHDDEGGEQQVKEEMGRHGRG